jgi:hypothetical protein
MLLTSGQAYCVAMTLTRTSRRTGSALPVITALVGSVAVVVLAGYLILEMEAAAAGALFDITGQPIAVSGEWVPYAIRAGLVVLFLVAVLVHRRLVNTRPARLTALAVLTVSALIAAYMFRPLLDAQAAGQDQQSLLLVSFIHGAISPYTLAMIGAVAASLIPDRRRQTSPRR